MDALNVGQENGSQISSVKWIAALTSGWLQRWPWIRSAGVDSGRNLRFSFWPESGAGIKILWKNGSGVTFQFRQKHESAWSFLVKTWVNLGWIDGSWSLNRSRILKFEKYPSPDRDSQTLEQERSRSLKKWLRPPLVEFWRFNCFRAICVLDGRVTLLSCNSSLHNPNAFFRSASTTKTRASSHSWYLRWPMTVWSASSRASS